MRVITDLAARGADKRACGKQDDAQRGHAFAQAGKGGIDRLQRSGDQQGKAPRQDAGDAQPFGAVVGEALRFGRREIVVARGGVAGLIWQAIGFGAGQTLAVAVLQQQHLAARAGAAVGDGLTQRDDAALLVKCRIARQIRAEGGCCGLGQSGFLQGGIAGPSPQATRVLMASAMMAASFRVDRRDHGAGERGEDIALAAGGLDGLRSGVFQLAAQATDMDIDDIGAGVEMQVPDVFQQLHPGDDLALRFARNR